MLRHETNEPKRAKLQQRYTASPCYETVEAQPEVQGLLYFRARYYDPATGRFVQRDPVWDPGNFGNQYSFVGNSPVAERDPLGEQRWRGRARRADADQKDEPIRAVPPKPQKERKYRFAGDSEEPQWIRLGGNEMVPNPKYRGSWGSGSGSLKPKPSLAELAMDAVAFVAAYVANVLFAGIGTKGRVAKRAATEIVTELEKRAAREALKQVAKNCAARGVLHLNKNTKVAWNVKGEVLKVTFEGALSRKAELHNLHRHLTKVAKKYPGVKRIQGETNAVVGKKAKSMWASLARKRLAEKLPSGTGRGKALPGETRYRFTFPVK